MIWPLIRTAKEAAEFCIGRLLESCAGAGRSAGGPSDVVRLPFPVANLAPLEERLAAGQ